MCLGISYLGFILHYIKSRAFFVTKKINLVTTLRYGSLLILAAFRAIKYSVSVTQPFNCAMPS